MYMYTCNYNNFDNHVHESTRIGKCKKEKEEKKEIEDNEGRELFFYLSRDKRKKGMKRK